eukprot:5315695-Heterocapsa_arctica.AAC.1
MVVVDGAVGVGSGGLLLVDVLEGEHVEPSGDDPLRREEAGGGPPTSLRVTACGVMGPIGSEL